MLRMAIFGTLVGMLWVSSELPATLLAAEPEQRSIMLNDNQGYTKGPFTAYMVPFNKGSLIAGTHYSERFDVDPLRFPANSKISWSWPAGSAKDPIRGFLAIDYGNYANTVPEMPIRSSRVAEIEALSCSYEVTLGGTTSGYDMIIDFFLTSVPAAKGVNFDDSIKFEVEVFLHVPPYSRSYANSVSSVGMFTSASGVNWNVSKDMAAEHGPDILFYPADGTNVLAATIDIKEMISWLQMRNIISGKEYFNGLALGVEPQQLDGSVTIDAFDVHYSPSGLRTP